MESPAVPTLLIGALFVEKGLITQEQLDVALEEQQRTGNRLGEVLVERFGVSRLDLAGALAEQWAEYERQGTPEQQASHSDVGDLVVVPDELSGEPDEAEVAPKRPIGEIFLERGMISTDELELALDQQRQSGRRLGEILVGQGNLSRLELASALADQWASFQKLRPPSASDGAASPQAAAAGPVMPTPETSPSAFTSPGMPVASSDQVDALRARLEALGAQLDQLSSTTREWREPLDRLSASFGERLGAVEQAAAERSAALATEDESKAEIALLATRVDELAASIATASSDPLPADLPDRVDELAAAIKLQEARLAELASKEGAGGQDPGRRDEIAALEARLSELAQQPVAAVEELRASVTTLASRLEEPVTSDEWREPLESLANDLRDRIATIEQAPAPASPEITDALRDEIASLATRIDAIPTPSEDWRAGIETLTARLDELAARPSEGLDELRVDLATLDARLSAIPAPNEEWRGELAGLAARIDELPTSNEDWRGEIAGLTARLDELAGRPSMGVDELRADLATLDARLSAIPTPNEDWRVELGQVAENLRVRFERIEADLAARAEDGAVAERFGELRGALDELASRVDAIPAPNEDWRDGLRTLSTRLDELPTPNEDWREALDTLVARVDAIPENLRVRLDRVDHDLAARAEHVAIAELSERLEALANGLPERFGELRASHDQLSAGVDAILPPSDEWRNELAQVVENLRDRLERVETGLEQRIGFDLLAGIRDELEALSARVDADLRERDEHAAGHGARVDWLTERVTQNEGIEQRLRDGFAPLVDGAVSALAERLAGIEGSLEENKAGAADLTPRLDELSERLEKQARRIEKLKDDGPTAAQVAEALGARLEASEAVATDVYASLDERLAALDGQVASASGRAVSDVESLRRELDDLRGVTAAAAEASTAHADQLAERLRAETAGQVAEIHAAQAAAFDLLQDGTAERERLSDERFSALERSQAKRSDVRELRAALGRVEQHIAAETAKEDTRVVAVESALRDGLASLASRLSESEGAYFQAGDSLRRSIEHLGSAIRGADAHRAPDHVIAEAPVVATSFLAFAPTSEGYRLVELDGASPSIGGLVEVPGCEAPFVVARLGASPLPFDRRPCAYLEIPA